MASEALEKLKSQVLTLTESERAELVRSLDAPSDEGVDEAWDAEMLLSRTTLDFPIIGAIGEILISGTANRTAECH